MADLMRLVLFFNVWSAGDIWLCMACFESQCHTVKHCQLSSQIYSSMQHYYHSDTFHRYLKAQLSSFSIDLVKQHIIISLGTFTEDLAFISNLLALIIVTINVWLLQNWRTEFVLSLTRYCYLNCPHCFVLLPHNPKGYY